MKRETGIDSIFESLLADIKNGKLEEKSYLPGERELAESFDVSRPTIRKVLARLRSSGMIAAVPGTGNIVCGRSTVHVCRKVMMLLPDLSNPYYGALARELSSHFKEHGIVLLCSDYRTPATLSDSIEALESDANPGAYLICFPWHIDDAAPIFSRLKSPGLLIHSCREVSKDCHLDQLIIDSFGGAYQAASHLISIGRKNILGISSTSFRSQTHPDFDERLRGCRQAVADAGLGEAAFSSLKLRMDGYDGGYELVQRALSAGMKFDALFCANDYVASGAVCALHDAGLSIPEDVAVTGFDDIPIARILNPPITTVRQPVDRIAGLACEMLCGRIDGDTGHARRLIIKCELTVRESTLKLNIGKGSIA